MVDQALHTAGRWLELLIGLLLGVFGVIEGFCLLVLTAAHVPENLQQIALIVVAALFIISALRLFGGVLRVLLTVFLLLLALHVMLRMAGR